MSDFAQCSISQRRITAVDANDLYDFMVIDAQQRDNSKSSLTCSLHSIGDRFYFSQLCAAFLQSMDRCSRRVFNDNTNDW